MKFLVEVEKTYYSRRDPDYSEVVTGEMPIEAKTKKEAIAIVDAMMEYKNGTCLQTNDPRIEWGHCEMDEADREYEDFSFGTTGKARKA